LGEEREREREREEGLGATGLFDGVAEIHPAKFFSR
jgi:hypothetical protein